MTTGYLSQELQIELKLMADRAALDTARIGDIINGYIASSQYKAMYDADRYYAGRHDILDATRGYFVNGQWQTDKVAANNKIPHPFLSILIDQKASKVAGKPISISIAELPGDTNPDQISDEARGFEDTLTARLGTTFDDKVYDWIVGASKHSVEWMHFYVDKRGELNYIVCPATEIIPVYDTQYNNELLYVIRFYQYELINSKGESQNLFKVEWWTKTGVEYWIQIEDGSYVRDAFYTVNPAPHWTVEYTATGVVEPHFWGRVPFVALPNNARGRTDLADIKALINAYDRVVTGWANDLDDFQEQILVVKNLSLKDREINAGISELALFVKNLKEQHVITIEGDGDVKNLKADIPVEAKEKFLILTRRAIYYFGRGVDSSPDVIGTAPSGVALQHLYALLNMKANDIIVKLKVALKDFFWFVTTYLAEKTGKSYDPSRIVTTFNPSQEFNKKEIIDGIKERRDFLSEETLLGLDPDVSDVALEMDRLSKQREREQQLKDRETARQVELAKAQNGQPAVV